MSSKVVIINPGEEPVDSVGLMKFLNAQRLEVDDKVDHIRVTCPSNYVGPLTVKVEDFNYWASEIQDA